MRLKWVTSHYRTERERIVVGTSEQWFIATIAVVRIPWELKKKKERKKINARDVHQNN